MKMKELALHYNSKGYFIAQRKQMHCVGHGSGSVILMTFW
jgi:hypothetical protein